MQRLLRYSNPLLRAIAALGLIVTLLGPLAQAAAESLGRDGPAIGVNTETALVLAGADNCVESVTLQDGREARLKAIAQQNDISLCFLMLRRSDAFLSEPSLFLTQFTFESYVVG